MPNSKPAVLIVGAGPTGLALACELTLQGVACRIIDQRRGPSEHSKALGVHARTLELLERYGVTQTMLERGLPLRAVNVFGTGKQLARIVTDAIPSRYQFVLSLPQNETEQVLIERLQRWNIAVEWERQLVHLESSASSVSCRVRGTEESASEETITIPWVVGCDGARSHVRHELKIPFEGQRYETRLVLADADCRWEHAANEVFVIWTRQGIAALIPLPQQRRFRLIVDDPQGPRADEELTTAWFQHAVQQRLAATPLGTLHIESDLYWKSQFTLSRRVVSRMREGRVFLVGDAAHIHSPLGAQGMNTGVQDAVNLGWKLALVVRERAAESLLDSYERERLPVARRVLTNTQWATHLAVSRNPVVHWLRNTLVPWVTSQPRVQARALLAISELDLHYRPSPIVRDEVTTSRRSTGPAAGDRLPDLPADEPHKSLYQRLHPARHTLLLFSGTGQHLDQAETLRSVVLRAAVLSDVLHVQCVVRPGMPFLDAPCDVIEDRDLRIHQELAIALPTALIIRPDRYIAFRSQPLAPERIDAYLSSIFDVRPGQNGGQVE